ncbi:1148_t:CDS:2, partial [Dentiscutata erythropus]
VVFRLVGYGFFNNNLNDFDWLRAGTLLEPTSLHAIMNLFGYKFNIKTPINVDGDDVTYNPTSASDQIILTAESFNEFNLGSLVDDGTLIYDLRPTPIIANCNGNDLGPGLFSVDYGPISGLLNCNDRLDDDSSLNLSSVVNEPILVQSSPATVDYNDFGLENDSWQNSLPAIKSNILDRQISTPVYDVIASGKNKYQCTFCSPRWRAALTKHRKTNKLKGGQPKIKRRKNHEIF